MIGAEGAADMSAERQFIFSNECLVLFLSRTRLVFDADILILLINVDVCLGFIAVIGDLVESTVAESGTYESLPVLQRLREPHYENFVVSRSRDDEQLSVDIV